MIFEISRYIDVKINMSDSIKYVGSVKVDVLEEGAPGGGGFLENAKHRLLLIYFELILSKIIVYH